MEYDREASLEHAREMDEIRRLEQRKNNVTAAILTILALAGLVLYHLGFVRVSYTAIVITVIVGAIVYGIGELRREGNEAWQRLADAFDGVTIRRVLNVAPKGSADRLDYDGTQHLGTFELTSDVLRFYRLKVKNGSVVEFPVDSILESTRIAGHHEPAATLVIESSDGRRFKIDASVPENLCARLVRLGKMTDTGPS
jgi:hypothetical protein